MRETIDDVINANIYHLQYVSKFRYRKMNTYILAYFYYSMIDSRKWNLNLRLSDVGSIVRSLIRIDQSTITVRRATIATCIMLYREYDCNNFFRY